MKKTLISLFICFLFAFNLVGQQKPIITMRSQATIGDTISFYLTFHKPTTAYIVNNGDTLLIEVPEANKRKTIQMKIENSLIEIYGDASSISAIANRSGYDDTPWLDSIDISACTELLSLSLEDHRKLEKIDLTYNTKLQYLQLYRCNLEKIDITHLYQLEKLLLPNNKFKVVDFPEKNTLRLINLAKNKLQEINLDNISDSLTSIAVGYNELIHLDLDRFSLLQDLHCAGNQLTKLDLSHLPSLKWVKCSDNQLTSLILPSNIDSLSSLYTNKNLLTSLDISSGKKLQYLDISNNRLTHLKLPIFSDKLESIDINSNLLEGEFVLPEYPSLKNFRCNNNQFTSIDMSKAPLLKTFFYDRNNLNYNTHPQVASNINWEDLWTDDERRIEREKREAQELKEEKWKNSKIRKAFPYPNFSFAFEGGYLLTVSKHATNRAYVGAVLGFCNTEKRAYHGKNIHQVWLGYGVYYGVYNLKKTEVIPTFSVVYSPSALYTRVAVSKYYIHPSIGINMLNIAQLHLGYSHGYREKNGIRISGLTLGINLTLGANHMFDLGS